MFFSIYVKFKDQFGVHDTEMTWFKSNLRKKASVLFQWSSIITKMCRTSQGSIIGPLLVLLYINDMTDCLGKITPHHYAEISSSSDDFDTLNKNSNFDLNNNRKRHSKN